MSVEKFTPTSKTPEVPEEEASEEAVEHLLSRLPEDIRDLWSSRIEELPLHQQVEKLEEILARRSVPIKEKQEYRLMPKGVEIFRSFPDDLRETIEIIRSGKRTVEIGYGKAGHVIANPKLHPDMCYKLLFDNEMLPAGTNDISVETDLQQDIGKLLDNRYGVRVPHVFGFISEPGTRAITMELMNAPSLRRVVERKAEKMPESFDIDIFFEALTNFINDMHELGYYHRDLHGGNVLVDRETGMPCVIDFGLSKYAPIEDPDVYKMQSPINGQMENFVLKSDEVHLQILKQEVQDYMANNQGV